jgi:SOS regulatory protein LexA
MEKAKNKIAKFYSSNRRMPTYAELAKLVGYRSKNSVYKLVQKLKKEGFIGQDVSGKILPENLFGEIKLLGLVEAGFPTPAEEELADTITLDEWLVPNKEASYMLKVKGESMRDAGIMPGDLVLVERTDKYKVGDIVIAEIDNKWTMKYLRKEKGGRFYLEAANSDYKDIYPEESLKVAAVVRGVVRKY